ncbi:MAG: helix-turn-helix domain-containing protein [Deltaproteobacteria bacterium]|nr:helix-turn-helix domain-containing protein [Deltaproteobacteria bacterium]
MKSSRPISPEFFDLAGASAYLGGALSVRTLRRLISMPGGLPYYRIGAGKILISKSDLDAWLARHRQEPLDLDKIAAEAVRAVMGEV